MNWNRITSSVLPPDGSFTFTENGSLQRSSGTGGREKSKRLLFTKGRVTMPDVDNLLTSFYQLDDEARKEVVETIQFKLQYHRDPERAEQIKQIKGW